MIGRGDLEGMTGSLICVHHRNGRHLKIVRHTGTLLNVGYKRITIECGRTRRLYHIPLKSVRSICRIRNGSDGPLFSQDGMKRLKLQEEVIE